MIEIIDLANFFSSYSAVFVTLITGAIGGQLVNHLIISKRDELKKKEEAINRYYHPLYEAIVNYFETCTYYNPSKLSLQGRMPYQQEKLILKIIEDGLNYADDTILRVYYRKKYSILYDDDSGLQDLNNSQTLMYSILKYYYSIVANKQLKKELKINIIMFQIWMICIELNLPTPEGAMSNKYYFDYDKIAIQCSINDIESQLNESDSIQKRKFLEWFLKKYVIKEYYGQVYSEFFDPEHIWEDSQAISKYYLLRNIVDNTDEELGYVLEFRERQQLRGLLLNDIYLSYFSPDTTLKYKYSITQDEYDSFHLEKRLALEYLLDSGEIRRLDNELITFIPTKLGIDLVEKLETELNL